MKKILHVNAGNIFGGLETMLLGLAEFSLRKKGTEHHFCICFQGRFEKELRRLGVPVCEIGSARYLRPLQTWKAQKKLLDFCRVIGPDVVVCHMAWSINLFGKALSKSGIPFVAHHHGNTAFDFQDRLAGFSNPRTVVVPSISAGVGWSQIYNRKIEVFNNPARVEFLKDFSDDDRIKHRQMLKITDNGKKILVCVSRIEKLKGHDILLKALALLNKREDWEMVFAGAPQKPEEFTYQNELFQLSDSLGLSKRIRWLGHVEDVRSLLIAADVYCQANRFPEGYSLSFVEAGCLGVPIITTAIGGALEAIKDNGILVARPEPVLFAEAIATLLEDEPLRIVLGKRGKNKFKFDANPDVCFPKYEKICLNI